MRLALCRLLFCLTGAAAFSASPSPARLTHAERLPGPLLHPGLLPADVGSNLNGPTMIRVPDWVESPLGRYYLYFAHHDDTHIRLAYADHPEGPFTHFDGGVLHVDQQTALWRHIASPDVVIDESSRQLFLFYHGTNPRRDEPGQSRQLTAVAVSRNGVDFSPLNVIVGPPYLRVFRHQEDWYAFNHSGELRHARRLGEPFEPIGQLISADLVTPLDPLLRGEAGAPLPKVAGGPDRQRFGIRHVGFDLHQDRLTIFFSCIGHRPERILATFVRLEGPASSWSATGLEEILQPELDWEGADLPLSFSQPGIARERRRELRDPHGYREGEQAWLLFSAAGEHAIGMARLHHRAASQHQP